MLLSHGRGVLFGQSTVSSEVVFRQCEQMPSDVYSLKVQLPVLHVGEIEDDALCMSSRRSPSYAAALVEGLIFVPPALENGSLSVYIFVRRISAVPLVTFLLGYASVCCTNGSNKKAVAIVTQPIMARGDPIAWKSIRRAPQGPLEASSKRWKLMSFRDLLPPSVLSRYQSHLTWLRPFANGRSKADFEKAATIETTALRVMKVIGQSLRGLLLNTTRTTSRAPSIPMDNTRAATSITHHASTKDGRDGTEEAALVLLFGCDIVVEL
jgi:hypothetical protein